MSESDVILHSSLSMEIDALIESYELLISRTLFGVECTFLLVPENRN